MAVAAVVAVVAFLVIKSIVSKLITVGLALVVIFAAYSQRSNIATCAERVKQDALATGPAAKTECAFFGIKVTLPPNKINDKLKP